MKQIDLNKLDRTYGIKMHDTLRDGSATNFDELKVSALLQLIVDNNNTMALYIDNLEAKLKRTQRMQRKTKKMLKKLDV